MQTSDSTLLIVAADRRELEGIGGRKQGFEPCSIGLRWSSRGLLQGRPVLLVANGPGRRNAREAASVACRAFRVSAVVSTGCVGALDPELRVGELFLANRVIEAESGVEYPVQLELGLGSASGSAPAVGALLTVDEVAQDADAKARLRETGARVVDMEASAVAAEAQARALPFYCVRAVSDDAATSFEIDLNHARRADGTFSGWRVAAQAGLSRRRWSHLATIYRDARKAFETLGAFFRNCRFADGSA